MIELEAIAVVPTTIDGDVLSVVVSGGDRIALKLDGDHIKPDGERAGLGTFLTPAEATKLSDALFKAAVEATA